MTQLPQIMGSEFTDLLASSVDIAQFNVCWNRIVAQSKAKGAAVPSSLVCIMLLLKQGLENDKAIIGLLNGLYPGPAVKGSVTFKPVKEAVMPPTNVPDDTPQTLALSLVDKLGAVGAAVDAPPAWTLDNTALATLTPSADGMSCGFVPTGTAGTGQVTAAWTAKGVANSAIGSFTIVAGEAVSGTISFSPAPTAAPAPTPAPTPSS
jgi:hypothetical protein